MGQGAVQPEVEGRSQRASEPLAYAPMRVSRTLALSVATEIALHTALGFLGFVVILLTQNLAQRLPELVAVGISRDEAAALLANLLPMVAAYSVPVGFLFGVLATVARISGDAELTALRACGLGIGALLGPALLLGAAVSGLTAFLMVHGEPAGRREMRALLTQVASRGGVLEPGRFRAIGPRVMYVQSRDRENRLQRILVADRSDPERPFLIFAERGHFAFDAETMVMRLELERGDIHFESADAEQHQRITFERFDYALDAAALFSDTRPRRPREMRFEQLAETVDLAEQGPLAPEVSGGRDANQFRTQYHRRLALPFAPLLFAALGVALGIRRTRSARSWGVLVCVALMTGYYTLLTFGEYLGESGLLPAALALWIPNALVAATAALLLYRTERGET